MRLLNWLLMGFWMLLAGEATLMYQPPSEIGYGQCGDLKGQVHCVGINYWTNSALKNLVSESIHKYSDTQPMNLVIWDSSFDDFEDHVFQGLVLGALSVQNCYMTGFPSKVLNSVNHYLQTLIINGASFTKLYKSNFSDLSFAGTLINLDLSRNRIRSIEESSFDSFVALGNLKLDQNRLPSLPQKLFQNLGNLRYLSIADNYIRSLNTGAFQPLKKLIQLNLKGNRISFIAQGQFTNNRRLRYLHLSDNALSNRLHEGIFSGLVNLAFLDLGGNPFVCNCQLEWLRRWLKYYNLLRSSNAVCDAPWQGVPFSQTSSFCTGQRGGGKLNDDLYSGGGGSNVTIEPNGPEITTELQEMEAQSPPQLILLT